LRGTIDGDIFEQSKSEWEEAIAVSSATVSTKEFELVEIIEIGQLAIASTIKSLERAVLVKIEVVGKCMSGRDPIVTGSIELKLFGPWCIPRGESIWGCDIKDNVPSSNCEGSTRDLALKLIVTEFNGFEPSLTKSESIITWSIAMG